MRVCAHLIILLLSLSVASALSLEESIYQNSRYIVVNVDLKKDQLKHYWKDRDDRSYGSIQMLLSALKDDRKELLFAINSGIYSKEERPLGLHIEEGEILTPLNEIKSNAGKGNFALFPNGVFYIDRSQQGHIKTTEAFSQLSDEALSEIEYATQSGPMLVIDGEYNERFIIDSDSKRIRSGVCMQNQNAIFVVTEDLINFYDFATYFKEELGCDNALYLDGSLARIYYKGRYYGSSAFARMRKLIGVWAVSQPLDDERAF